MWLMTPMAAVHMETVALCSFRSVVRSKGICWLATRPDEAAHWSQAGRMLQVLLGAPEWYHGGE